MKTSNAFNSRFSVEAPYVNEMFTITSDEDVFVQPIFSGFQQIEKRF